MVDDGRSPGARSSDRAGKSRDKSTVQSVERSLDLLEYLATGGPQVAIVDLAQQTGLHASTVHRLLSTLVRRGYVRQDPLTSKYSLGIKPIQLASEASHFSDLRSISRPFLRELMELTQETTNLVILDGDGAVYIEQEEGPRLMRMFTKIGRRVPLHCTGVGKVLMSHMPEEQVDAIIASCGLAPFTDKTITDPDKLKAELRAVRARGFALDNEEQEEGVRCVAAPVYDRDWRVVAALSVSSPVTRLSEERAVTVAAKVTEVATELSVKLGCKPNLPGALR